MNPQDPLAGLKPLREPPPVDWWPPAPGWWMLLAVLLMVLGAVAILWYRRRQQSAYRRLAHAQLERLFGDYQSTGNATQFATDLNALLKRVALIAFPQRDLAALHGEQWLAFLNQSVRNSAPFNEQFANAHYRGISGAQDIEGLYRSAAHWIKHHEVAQ